MPNHSIKPLTENERLVLNVIRRHGCVARSAITADTPLTQPWVHRLVDQLLARGLVAAGPPQRGTRGQPSVTLTLERTAAYAVGISVETDSVRMCLADLSCCVVDNLVFPGQPAKMHATLQNLAMAMRGMLERHQIPTARVIGVGLSLPGFFVNEGAQINTPEPLREWALVDLQPIVEAAFGMPVSIQNNANAAAVGENLIGVGRWAKTFCYLAFGYGFGSGIVIDGKPYLGRRGNAGELTFGAPNLEGSSRPALRYLLDDLRSQGVDVSSVEQIRERFNPNWPGVDAWITRVQPALNRVVNAISGLLDPDAIVFGGEMPSALGLELINRTDFWGSEHRYGTPPPKPRLVLAEGGSSATAVGAALLPLAASFFE